MYLPVTLGTFLCNIYDILREVIINVLHLAQSVQLFHHDNVHEVNAR